MKNSDASKTPRSALKFSDVDPARVLWSVNVFDRIDQLRCQEAVLRGAFGPSLEILVFCNNASVPDQKLRFRESHLVREGRNSGHHSGVRDAHNSTCRFLRDRPGAFDVVFSAHADCLPTDPSLISRLADRFLESGRAVGRLRPPGCPDDYLYNDLFLVRPDAWVSAGELDAYCDGDFGIEFMFMRHLLSRLSLSDTLDFSCEDLLWDRECHRFGDVDGTGESLLRDNDLGKEVGYLAKRGPSVHRLIVSEGLVPA